MTPSFDPSNPWLLTPVGGAAPDGPFPITAKGLILGRDPGCDVVLAAARCPGVSARHARVRLVAAGPIVEDLGSRNGTLIEGEAVAARELESGEEFELGQGGPRFLVMAGNRLDETVAVPRSSVSGARAARITAAENARERRRLGEETMLLMRKDLGLPEDGGVTDLLSRHRLRVAQGLALVLALAGAAGWFAFDFLRGREQAATASFEQRTRELDAEVREAVREQEAIWAEERRSMDLAREEWQQRQSELVAEREQLLAAIARLEAGEEAGRSNLLQLQEELVATNATLARYDPVSLEQAVVSGVSRIERSVVMIEARQYFRERGTDQPVFLENSEGDGQAVSFNVSGTGQMLGEESSGSGFCISPDGWIVTNAHVVFRKRDVAPIQLGPDLKLEPAVDLTVTFTGSSERHPAKFVARSFEGQRDLALIKIEPFEGMPYLDGIDLDVPLPPTGAEVFLIGFPLGRQVIQDGDTVIASAFRGIVSRAVDYYLQVDAVVHPGASGGPVVDTQGRIVGVVVGMQTLDASAESSAIGYIIPVAEVGEIWPPPADGGGAAPR